MTTGSFENWAGNISEIGVIYPFEGTEFIMVIAGVVFWLWWHITQTARENREMEEVIKKHGSKDSLKKSVNHEDAEHP